LIENAESDIFTKDYVNSLFYIPAILEKALARRDLIKKFAKHLAKENTVIMTADGISYSLAKEGALKIKETSYKNISAAILGEFMHGHVAVLNNKSTLIFISVDEPTERSISNLNKIKADYNPTLVVIGVSSDKIKPDLHLNVECENEIQQLFANVVILQLTALEIALKLKRNVDNPKGLHKVVVENSI